MESEEDCLVQPFYNAPGFWAFLTAMAGLIRWLLRVSFHYKRKSQLEKAKLDLSVENLKADNTNRTLAGLNEIMNQILPMVKHHEEVIQNLEKSVTMVGVVEKGLLEMSNNLKKEYEDFRRIVPKLTVSLEQTLMKVSKIETEVIEVKKDYLFIRNKLK